MQGLPVDEQLRELEATDALDQTYVSKMLASTPPGWGHFAAGRLDQAATSCGRRRSSWIRPPATTSGPSSPGSPSPGNDPDTADHWAQVHWDSVAHGGASEADHIALLAAVRGLRGDRSAAIRDFRDAIRRYRDLRLDLDEAIMAIDMVYVLGVSDSLTADAVARARTTFAANHARAYLDQLEAALAHGAHMPPVAAPPGAPRADRKASVPAS